MRSFGVERERNNRDTKKIINGTNKSSMEWETILIRYIL